MAEPTTMRWHRLLGLVLADFFRDTAWDVEIERDLSQQQQLLDVLILRRRPGPAPALWPDGLDGPADHFLLTFKSLRQPLSVWAIQELVGHYVSYRKLVSPATDQLLPEAAFRLVAAAMRFPQKLAGQMPLQMRGPGVYDLEGAATPVRVLVLNEMPASAANVVWNLFSGQVEVVRSAQERIQSRLTILSTELNRLWAFYQLEGIPMPYTKADFEREVREEALAKMTPEEVIAYLTPEKVAARLTPEQRLAGLTPEQRLAGLTPEQLAAFLTPEQLQALLRKNLGHGRSTNGA